MIKGKTGKSIQSAQEIEIRIGLLGHSGSYLTVPAMTKLKEINEFCTPEEWETCLIFKDWRNLGTYRRTIQIFHSQYPLQWLFLKEYPLRYTLFHVLVNLQYAFGEPEPLDRNVKYENMKAIIPCVTPQNAYDVTDKEEEFLKLLSEEIAHIIEYESIPSEFETPLTNETFKGLQSRLAYLKTIIHNRNAPYGELCQQVSSCSECSNYSKEREMCSFAKVKEDDED